MGRWGYRLFEGDQDLDAACALNRAIDDTDFGLSRMIHQTDMLALHEAREHYRTEGYKAELVDIVTRVRERFDTGLGDQMLEKLRSQETGHESKYRVVLAGALLMRAGAKIKPDDLEHLRGLVPQINCNYGYTLPMFDDGFREPGRVQFLAALDNYVAGTPRNYQEPSCFTCGKVESDLGSPPKKCLRCERAWYCNKECQRQQWRKHKPTCKAPEQRFSLNV